jgi:DNA-binding SARP family transcriptional activator
MSLPFVCHARDRVWEKIGKSLAHRYLTGGLRFDGPEGSFDDADLPGGQGRLALGALAVHRRPLERGALAEIVWDARVPDKWEGALSTIVSKIRSLFTRAGLDGREIVVTVAGTYALVLPAGTWVDVEDATRRLDRAEHALRRGDAAAATTDGTVASSILRRPFLAGVDSRWADEQRRALDEQRYRCSVTLAEAWIALGDHGLAATIAADAIRLDPLREIPHRLLVEAELARGDRAAAQRALLACEHILADELGVQPSEQTQALAARVRG